MQVTLDRWRGVLPGDEQGIQRSAYLSSNNNNTGSHTTRTTPVRLFYDRQTLHRNTLVLQPTHTSSTTTAFTNAQARMSTFQNDGPLLLLNYMMKQWVRKLPMCTVSFPII